MNRAQAIIPLGFGCFAWRDDGPPVRRGRSAFALELRRCHNALEHPFQDERQRLRREEVKAFAEKALDLLRTARERLDFGQICVRLGVADAKSRTLRNVMDRLCDEGSVQRLGTYRKVYWVE